MTILQVNVYWKKLRLVEVLMLLSDSFPVIQLFNALQQRPKVKKDSSSVFLDYLKKQAPSSSTADVVHWDVFQESNDFIANQIEWCVFHKSN